MSYVRYIYVIIFFCLPTHCLNGPFDVSTFLVLIKSNLSVISFMNSSFGVLSKKSLPNAQRFFLFCVAFISLFSF